MSAQELPLQTASELIAWLAARLNARADEKTREDMPCVDLHALDGTVLTVTLRNHHWGGDAE